MRRKSQDGFTLVELLVVVGIMAILAAMIVPVMGPLVASKGVDGSAQKLQSVLLNARALAAKNNVDCSVTFHMAVGNTGTTFSRDWENCWYAIVLHGQNGIDDPFNPVAPRTLADNVDDDFNFSQVGPRFTLEKGSGFLALSYADNSDDNSDSAKDKFNEFHSNGAPLWNTANTAAVVPNGYSGNFRIVYSPDGSATFVMPSGFAANGLEQYISIANEGTVEDKSHYNNRVTLTINQHTGLVEVLDSED